MKALGILLLLAGLAGLLLGGYEYAFNDSSDDCERFRLESIALLDEAIAAGEGTPRADELVAEAETKSMLADLSCEAADGFRTRGMLIMLGGLVAAVVGFVLMRRRKAPPPAVAG